MSIDLLTEKIRNGDVHALEKIYRLEAPNVLRMVAKLVKDQQDVEEVVQDIFYEFWLQRASFKQGANYKGLLYTIAKRRTIDKFRKQVKALYFESADFNLIGNHNIEADVHFDELKVLMEKHIETLPPKRKLIFSLRKDEGLTNAQIAQKLGISTTMVEKQMKLANQSLREYFHHYSETLCITAVVILFFL